MTDTSRNSCGLSLRRCERLAVGRERDLFFGAAFDVVEHRLRQLSFGDDPEVVGHVRAVEQPLHRIALELAELDEFEHLVKVHGYSRATYSVLVMAPVSAPCTSLAYLPSTPLV